MSQFIAPTGYVDLDNDCEYSIDRKSTRSREAVNPQEDLAFYFNTYIVPKYGLNNINISNVASFMKELEMNWTKLSPDARDKVMNIMVDGILNRDSTFKTNLMQKMSMQSNQIVNTPSRSTFGKSMFGSIDNNKNQIALLALVISIGIAFYLYKKQKGSSYGRLS